MTACGSSPFASTDRLADFLKRPPRHAARASTAMPRPSWRPRSIPSTPATRWHSCASAWAERACCDERGTHRRHGARGGCADTGASAGRPRTATRRARPRGSRLSAFADSSALVKLYADELGHEAVRALRAPLVVSALARVEVAAAIWRKHRAGELDLDDTHIADSRIRGRLRQRVGRDTALPCRNGEGGVLERAAGLPEPTACAPMTPYSSPLRSRRVDADDRCSTFAAFDRELLAAAVAEERSRSSPGRR